MSPYAFNKEKKTWLRYQNSFSISRSSTKRKGSHDQRVSVPYKSLQKIEENLRVG